MAGKFTNPLDNIRIASPCKANWEEMFGNERKRFCGECKLNVYNLSGMSRREAENLILQFEGRLCVRFFRRADGSILTKDCPVGWQAIKHRVSKMATAFASLVFGALSGIGLANYFAQSNKPISSTGEINVENTDIIMKTLPTPQPEFKLGQIKISDKVEQGYPTDGRISNIEEVRQEIKNQRKH
ncbi:hypothetical protein BH24ACI2_BH24ACI2_04000 [soil metagenome]|jgi:hypothetical protein|nr:hypothetical protein [Acidobacteriota bacterium]